MSKNLMISGSMIAHAGQLKLEQQIHILKGKIVSKCRSSAFSTCCFGCHPCAPGMKLG